MKKIYPRTGDTQTVYLNAVVKDPSIEVGDYTIYNDFVSDPLLFERNFTYFSSPGVWVILTPFLFNDCIIFCFCWLRVLF